MLFSKLFGKKKKVDESQIIDLTKDIDNLCSKLKNMSFGYDLSYRTSSTSAYCVPSPTNLQKLSGALDYLKTFIPSKYTYTWREETAYLIVGRNTYYKLYGNGKIDNNIEVLSYKIEDDGSFVMTLRKEDKYAQYEYTEKYDVGKWQKKKVFDQKSYVLTIDELNLIDKAIEVLQQNGVTYTW